MVFLNKKIFTKLQLTLQEKENIKKSSAFFLKKQLKQNEELNEEVK